MKTYNSSLKIGLSLMAIMAISLVACSSAEEVVAKKVIYETDMCLDVDDVGALAVLHALQNNGEVELLAVCFNEVHPSGVAAIDAINTWYGRGDIPVGTYKGTLSEPDKSPYLDAVGDFPHDLENEGAPSALDVYRKVLGEQPDGSVTIISVGFLNNLSDLITAEPELVAKKVKELVVMAGIHNDGFNLTRHDLSSTSQNVIENWPTPLIISQEGHDIHTGAILKDAPQENPVREGFYKFFGDKYEGRSSWDEMAVLYGVRGLGDSFIHVTEGAGTLRNGFIWDLEPGSRTLLNILQPKDSYSRLIEDLMMVEPQKRF